MNKTMIIEPHADDGLMGCGGWILTHPSDTYYFLLVTASDYNSVLRSPSSRNARISEYEQYAERFGATWITEGGFPFDCESQLDVTPKAPILAALEQAILTHEPDILFIPFASFHQDHKALNQMCRALLRSPKFSFSTIYEYENCLAPPNMTPNVYLRLSEDTLDLKLKRMAALFPSQVTNDTYVSMTALMTLAQYRGAEAGHPYAEAYNLVRNTI